MLLKNCVQLTLIRNHLLMTCSTVKNVTEAAPSYSRSHSSYPWLSVELRMIKKEGIVWVNLKLVVNVFCVSLRKLYGSCAYRCQLSQKRMSDPLELILKTAVSYLMTVSYPLQNHPSG